MTVSDYAFACANRIEDKHGVSREDTCDEIEIAMRGAGAAVEASLRCAVATMKAIAATNDFYQCGVAIRMAEMALADWEGRK